MAIDHATLHQLQQHFHALIRERADDLIRNHTIALPDLTALSASAEAPAWFPVPGMYGSFQYWLQGDGTDAKLVTESWSRIVSGSGQRHEMAVVGSQLVDEGFV